ncbi:MAG: CBS domain-containing protein [Rhodospirillales bacterium]|nr:CBS domain-containing protein [Rhodospirillales bacterium]
MTTVAAILRHKGDEVVTVAPNTTIAELARVLRDRRIGAVLVTDRIDQMLGIVSERDIVNSLAGVGAITLEMTAAQLMTRVLNTVTPETTVVQAMTMMTERRVRHLPVIAHQQVVGMISIGDVVKARILAQDQAVDSLRAYIAGTG